MTYLSIRQVGKRYGEVNVVKNVSIDIDQGEFVSLLGPSGCGKTTILRMVAGLIEPSAGQIIIGGRDITRLPPHKRNIGLVFQSYALFPHMTVFENVAFGLRRKGKGGDELSAKVDEALALVRLSGLGNRYPRQLSGGQQQRVAMARAIAPQPNVILFDEPLSNLDAKLRDEMQIELKRLQRELNTTTLFVTHDQEEALSLSDRVCVMHNGIIQQLASPEEIYRSPATPFVADFIGKPNRLLGHVINGVVHIDDDIPFCSSSGNLGETVDLFIRKESILLSRQVIESRTNINGKVTLRSFLGTQVQYLVALSPSTELIVNVSSSSDSGTINTGEEVFLAVDPLDVIIMPRERA